MENESRSSLRAIVLVTGEGKRMKPHLQAWFGVRSPKQYISFIDENPMLQQTLDRVGRLIPIERTDAEILDIPDSFRHDPGLQPFFPPRE